MSVRNFNSSKQLFTTFTVALAFFVGGLVWSAATIWKADYFIQVKFNLISDRYNPNIGEAPQGNLYVRSEHWGNMTNRVEKAPGARWENITARFASGVAWFNNTQFTFNATDIDWANVDAAGGNNKDAKRDLASPGDYVDPEFHIVNSHFKSVNANDVEDYWAGAYTTIYFSKPVGADSGQKKVVIDLFAPNGTLENHTTASELGTIRVAN